jgi:adenosylmethionine-8-amino-7-oxononanoate aminotransferase
MPNHVFHRSTLAKYPTAVKGDGCYIVDSEGKRYFDGSCGAAVSCLGHSNEEVRDAMKQQIDKISFAHTGFFTNEPMEELADFLIERAPQGLDRVYFFSGGSEAIEAAIKLSRQYFLEQGKTEKSVIIARKQSYHGNTLGALSAGGNEWRREQFKPLLVEMHHISACYEYRLRGEDETQFVFGQRVANELEEKILEVGAEKVAAFMCEPVVGATLGCVPAVDGYLKRIREICTKYDVLMILDEVMCGMGRTGSLYACEQDGVAPDILTLAKGLGGGYQPIGAMLASSEIYNAINKGTGFFQHGHTYIGHAVGCAAALKVQQIIERDGLLANVKDMGQKFTDALGSTLGDHPYVGDIRGRGLFIGVELVQDRETKKPFDPSAKVHAKIKSAAMNEGLMCYPMGGTIDGAQGAHVMFAPPFIMNEKHIDEIVDKFSKSLAAVFGSESGLRKVG